MGEEGGGEWGGEGERGEEREGEEEGGGGGRGELWSCREQHIITILPQSLPKTTILG